MDRREGKREEKEKSCEVKSERRGNKYSKTRERGGRNEEDGGRTIMKGREEEHERRKKK